MANRRDYAAEYRRRQERAQAEGYASDYERRMARVPTTGDPGYDEERREYQRGHRGEGYLRDYAQPGDAVQLSSERDQLGRFTTLTLYPADPERDVRSISIRGMSSDEINDLLDDLRDDDVAVSAGYLEE